MFGKSSGEAQKSKVFRFDDMPKHVNANGGVSREVFLGTLVTGETVGVHESMQPAGAKPNPAHTIEHTEFICVREGTMEFMHDGKAERASAGDVLFVAKGTLHGVKNVGDGPISYFVVQIGGDMKGNA